jgi:hypothetical protein
MNYKTEILLSNLQNTYADCWYSLNKYINDDFINAGVSYFLHMILVL